jgi:hypothetical protein
MWETASSTLMTLFFGTFHSSVHRARDAARQACAGWQKAYHLACALSARL